MANTHIAEAIQVANKKFDFVVVGGGVSGLCVASRLSEDPQVSVLVLEAGQLHLHDPLIDIPTGFFQQMGNPTYDWIFETVPQRYTGDRSFTWNRAKSLGGSSNINYMLWTRPSKEDIDGWERLGNPGWNWERFLPYLKKAEGIHHPSQDIITRDDLNFDPLSFGHEGPVSVAYGNVISGLDATVRKTFEARGIPILHNAFEGKSAGTWTCPSSIYPDTQTRASALTSYFLPNSGRDNLHVLTGAHVERLLLKDEHGTEPITATGVQFTHDGETYQVQAGREVILCAGTLKSPQVLELSGIGDRDILEPFGIDVRLHLPGVGSNVQEHLSQYGITYELRENADVQTWDSLADPIEQERHLKLYTEKREGLIGLTVTGITFPPLKSFSDKIDALLEGQLERISKARDGYRAGYIDQFKILADRLRDPEMPDCELITNALFNGAINKPVLGKKYVSFILGLAYPWSRGSVHIGSKDHSVQPIMDPHYLEEEIDMDILIELFKFTRSMGDYEPLKSLIAKEADPGPGSIKTDAEIRDYIKKGLKTTWHTTSSLSMLPREKGGVVDPSLRVWGTKNIRVADISIIPLQIGVHTQATAYAIAELAADIIRKAT